MRLQEGVYTVTGDIAIPNNGELILDPGVRLEFDQDRGIIVGSGTGGKLTAVGDTSKPIVLTRRNTTGYWGCIAIKANGVGILRNVQIEYAGGNSPADSYKAISVANMAMLSMNDCQLRQTAFYPLLVYSSPPGTEKEISIIGCVFEDMNPTSLNLWSGILLGYGAGNINIKFKNNIIRRSGSASNRLPGVVVGNDSGDKNQLIVEGNTFVDNGIGISFNTPTAIATIRGNIFENQSVAAIQGGINNISRSAIGVGTANTFNNPSSAYISINGGELITSNGLLGLDAAPYRVTQSINIGKSTGIKTTLTIMAGVRVEISSRCAINVYGSLNAVGSSAQPILLMKATTIEA